MNIIEFTCFFVDECIILGKVTDNIVRINQRMELEQMLKLLLESRIANMYHVESSFQQHIYELKNCLEVLGIEATSLRIEYDQIAVGYIVGNSIFFKSMNPGQTSIKLSNGKHEASVQLIVQPSGKIDIDVKPYVGKAEIVFVYYRTILADTAIAIDLKGALKSYLVAHQLLHKEATILEVHYQSMHPKVLRDAYAGNFVLGYHADGREITCAEEYTLANRIATLKFSKIIIQQQGVRKEIELQKLLTFKITKHVFVSCEAIDDRLYHEEKLNS